MFPNDPATDIARLAKLRSLIADLKAEEAMVRSRLLTLRDGEHGRGRGPVLRIATQKRRVFNREALPETIIQDPKNWIEKTSRVLKILGPSSTSRGDDPLID